MYSRRRLLIAMMASCAMAMASPAMAQDDRVMRGVLRQLERQGFEIEQITRTWLGRVRILASRPGQSRELVFDPRNGAVLRDFISDDDDDDDRPRIPDLRDADDDADHDRDDAAVGDKDRDEDKDRGEDKDTDEDDRDKNDDDEGGGDDENDDDE